MSLLQFIIKLPKLSIKMQHKNHTAKRIGFCSGLPRGSDKVSFRCKLSASLESFGDVLCLGQSGSRYSVKNRADIKYCGETTWIKHWYFPRILLQSIPRVTIPDMLALIIRSFHDRWVAILNEGKGAFAKCNRWRIPQNSSKSFKPHLNRDLPISQVHDQGGVL